MPLEPIAKTKKTVYNGAMRYAYLAFFLIIPAVFGCSQETIRMRRVNVWYSGLYHVSKQRSPDLRHIIYDDFHSSETFIHSYQQYENILFFRNINGKKNLILDGNRGRWLYTYMDTIDSIVFTDKNTITIKGSHTVKNRDWEWSNKISEEITYKINNYSFSYLNYNVPDSMIGKEIPQNKQEGNEELFFEPIEIRDNKQFIFYFKEYNIYCNFDLSQFREPYDYVNIKAIYNTTFDMYFIFISTYKSDH